MNRLKTIFTALVFLSFLRGASAQIPVEVFAGDKKASVDAMFFKYFKNGKDENSKFLFFSRNRSTVDYQMNATTNLPSFGLTEAISYNHPKLQGFAPVGVVQIFNRGVFSKAGIQYVHLKKELTVFSWFVSETVQNPDLDYFLLFRYTPKLTERLNLFTQLESANSFPTERNQNFSFTQRIRFGLSWKYFQFGIGGDFSESGKSTFTRTNNLGGFVRYEFR